MTEKATEEHKKATLKEEIELAILNIQTEKLKQGIEMKRGDLAELTSIGVTMESFGIPAQGKYKEYFFNIDENYKVTIIEKNNNVEEVKNVGINSELEALLKEANMQITLQDILNTPAIMDTVEGLIPLTTQDDVTRTVEENGTVSYKDNRTGAKITAESEHTDSGIEAWKVFDKDASTGTLSKQNGAKGYYLEYEFPEEIYAMQIKFTFVDGVSAAATRKLIIQGYDEQEGYKDLANEITITKAYKSFYAETIQNLDCSKAYKKYRVYVTDVSGETSYSGFYEIQLYGVSQKKVSSSSSEKMKKLLLSNSSLDEIKLEHMVTNEEFTQRLIHALSMDTVKNNQILMKHMPSLIPVITENDVTRNVEENGTVSYKDNRTGAKITVESEHTDAGIEAWKVFDKDASTGTLSKRTGAKGYYIEYEFPEEMYVTQIKFTFVDGASAAATRKLVIQGYDEQEEYKDLANEITITKAYKGLYAETIQNLDFSKPYKKYRVYVTDASGETSYSGFFEMQLYGKLGH